MKKKTTATKKAPARKTVAKAKKANRTVTRKKAA